MTLITIFSDVQGEYEQLEKILKKNKELGVDCSYFLGDLIQNGISFAENRCVNLIKKAKKVYMIKGNHDSNYEKLKRFSEDDGYINAIFLRNCPTQIFFEENSILLVHSISKNLERVIDEEIVFKEFMEQKEQYKELKIIFFGHSHAPYIFEGDGRGFKPIKPDEKNKFKLHTNRVYVICPGSVCKEKNENKNSFLVFDDDNRTILMHYLN
jgi:predicted phosphodiesterase